MVCKNTYFYVHQAIMLKPECILKHPYWLIITLFCCILTGFYKPSCLNAVVLSVSVCFHFQTQTAEVKVR